MKTLFALLLLATVSSLTVFADNSISKNAPASSEFVKAYVAPAPTAKPFSPSILLLPSDKPARENKQMACYNPPPPQLPNPNCGDWPPAVKTVLQWLGLA